MMQIQRPNAAHSTADYQKTIRVEASPRALFDALTTPSGLAAWWAPVSGSGVADGELRFLLGHPDPLIIVVDEATPPASVRWTVVECNFLTEWVGTHPTFTITPAGGEAAELHFRHCGLTAELDCIDVCTRGWDHFLSSLRRYLEAGEGEPFGSGADVARRTRRLEDRGTSVKVSLGNHSAVRVPRADRAAIRSFYRDVLGCVITRASDQKDDIRMGEDFFIAFLYEDADAALGASGFMQAIYLELKAEDVEEMRRRIVAFGVTVLDVPDPHLYFQAPGGQVFRLVGFDEDLSEYEGTEHGEQFVGRRFETHGRG